MKIPAKIWMGIIALMLSPFFVQAQPDPVSFSVTDAPEQVRAGVDEHRRVERAELPVEPIARVPEARETDVERAVRAAVGLGGDADTLACIAGAVAEAMHGVPAPIAAQARSHLTGDLAAILDRFDAATGTGIA